MCLKQRHRCLLLGLLVLGCVGLAHTTATGGTPEESITWPVIVNLKTANFVTVCTRELTKVGACDAVAANAVATRLVEVGKIFAGPEFDLPQAKLRVAFKFDVVRSGLTIGFAGPAGSFANLGDLDPVVVVGIGGLPAAAAHTRVCGG